MDNENWQYEHYFLSCIISLQQHSSSSQLGHCEEELA